MREPHDKTPKVKEEKPLEADLQIWQAQEKQFIYKTTNSGKGNKG
jgi:hypothetical protein